MDLSHNGSLHGGKSEVCEMSSLFYRPSQIWLFIGQALGDAGYDESRMFWSLPTI